MFNNKKKSNTTIFYKYSLQQYCKIATFEYAFAPDFDVELCSGVYFDDAPTPVLADDMGVISNMQRKNLRLQPTVRIKIQLPETISSNKTSNSVDLIILRLSFDPLAILLLEPIAFPINKMLLLFKNRNKINCAEINQNELCLTALLDSVKPKLYEAEQLLRAPTFSQNLGNDRFIGLYLYLCYFTQITETAISSQVRSLICRKLAKRLFNAHSICTFIKTLGRPEYAQFVLIPWSRLDGWGTFSDNLIPFLKDSPTSEAYNLTVRMSFKTLKVEKSYRSAPPQKPKFYAILVDNIICVMSSSRQFNYTQPILEFNNTIVINTLETPTTSSEFIQDQSFFFTIPLIAEFVFYIKKQGIEWKINGEKTLQEKIFQINTTTENNPDALKAQTKKNNNNLFFDKYWAPKDLKIDYTNFDLAPDYIIFCSSNKRATIAEFVWKGTTAFASINSVFSVESSSGHVFYQIPLTNFFSLPDRNAPIVFSKLKIDRKNCAKDIKYYLEIFNRDAQVNSPEFVEVLHHPFEVVSQNFTTLPIKKQLATFFVHPEKFLLDSTTHLSNALDYKVLNCAADQLYVQFSLNCAPELVFPAASFFATNLAFVFVKFKPLISADILMEKAFSIETPCDYSYLHSLKQHDNNQISFCLDLYAAKFDKCVFSVFCDYTSPNTQEGKFLLFQIQVEFDWLTSRRYRVDATDGSLIEV